MYSSEILRQEKARSSGTCGTQYMKCEGRQCESRVGCGISLREELWKMGYEKEENQVTVLLAGSRRQHTGRGSETVE
jgi:hypothetical protein